jgi:uncharacterized FlaG/YvyC family protein
LSAALTSDPIFLNSGAMDREIVAAIRSLNKPELLGQERELAYRRDPRSGRYVIQIRDKASGDVVDQIPSETLLELRESLGEAIGRGESKE